VDRAVIEDGGSIPEPSPIAKHQADTEFEGWIWAIAEWIVQTIGQAKRVNITLPERILASIDLAELAWEIPVPVYILNSTLVDKKAQNC